MVEKNQQLQMMLEYDYRIEREKKESERKRIEAEGIRQFQDIVKDGITDRYLMWKGIDATLQLAQSSNSKVIVVGSGKTGLPILLNWRSFSNAFARSATTRPSKRPWRTCGPPRKARTTCCLL